MSIKKRVEQLKEQLQDRQIDDSLPYVSRAVARSSKKDLEKLIKLTGADLKERTSYQDHLLAYVKAVHPKYKIAKVHEIIAEHLQKVADGEIDRLMINVPPRYGKTLLGAVHFGAWWLGNNPDKSIIQSSYSDSYAKTISRKVRDTIKDSPEFAEIFPDVQLKYGAESASNWTTTKGGEYLAVGRGGSVTGHGAHLLVVDDMIKNFQESFSEAIKSTTYDWYKTTLFTRLEDEAAIIFINTRWCWDDLPGRLLEDEPHRWQVVSLPALFETDKTISGHTFKAGEVLWPGKYNVEKVREQEKILGDFFYALYQQDPLKHQGSIVNPDWWGKVKEIPPRWTRKTMFWDTGFKDEKTSSNSACTVWIETETDYYLIDCWYGKLQFPDLKEKFLELHRYHTPDDTVIEDKASGQSLIQEIKHGSRITVNEYKPDGSKMARLQSITPKLKSGRVHILDGQKWTNSIINACSKFPQTPLKDVVDTISMALAYMRQAEHFKPRAVTPEQVERNRKRKRGEKPSLFDREKHYKKTGEVIH